MPEEEDMPKKTEEALHVQTRPGGHSMTSPSRFRRGVDKVIRELDDPESDLNRDGPDISSSKRR